MSNGAVRLRLRTRYLGECVLDGRLLWKAEFHNVVTVEGRNKALDLAMKTGGTPAWYVFLKGTGTMLAGDTMASHSGWSEITAYSGSRPAYVMGTIADGTGDNSASKAAFNITSDTTIFGFGLCSNNTKGGNTGTLLSGGDFASSQFAPAGSIVNVTISGTM